MADKNLVQQLKRWATEEFNLPADRLPNDSYFKTLCVGTGKSIWTYIIHHVYQQRNVQMMRGNLQWYKVLQDKESKQKEGESVAEQQSKLQKKIEQLRAEIGYLDTQISATEEQMATQEQSINCTWSQVQDSRTRDLLLQAFRQRCASGRMLLADDIQAVNGYYKTLEQMKRKAEVEVMFESQSPISNDGYKVNSNAATEAQVLCEVRQLCQERVQFFQSLQESELKTDSAANHMWTTMFHYWLNSVEQNLLASYPPNQIISALQYLASKEQNELEEKVSSLDITKDVSALGFRYEGDHLHDTTEEEKNLPSVKALLQAAWQDVENSFVELAQTRTRVQQLRKQLLACRKEAEQQVSGGSDKLIEDSTLGQSSLDLELQCVMQTAARDYIRDWCVQLDQQARSRQETLKSLKKEEKNILDFRKQVIHRQEQIRCLIEGNSTAKKELIRLHKELQGFLRDEVVIQFDSITAAARALRNNISKETRQFGSISLNGLDRRTVEGEQRTPASRLSIHRLHDPTFSSLCHTLDFPMYKAPEEFIYQACHKRLELRFLRQLLHRHSVTLQKTQKDSKLLREADHKALLAQVTEEDQKLLSTLIPRVRALVKRTSQGLSYGHQVKTAISYWWDQPVQHVLPEVTKGGLTFQQWLQRWRLATQDL
ncbi:HAUS augmin-like complex subunit 5 isoform X1 [Synchiropus splendidus]|uniref:HAUS augmin-like complex subunit 5 isoform X1 n=1 Tax=Synchiropus splendidus TaxID=270530 RepID=UPI00237D4DE1|nr:HAUS augmin-like complex subunit 5 isoform X1 [Synchiropus splendidus]